MAIPRLAKSEKPVPPRPGLKIPTFPAHSFPVHGNAVLLVIPTGNKQKQLLLHEYLVRRAPEGVVVHTITVPVESGVGEQPYNGAGIEGAFNRINNALNQLHEREPSELLIKKSIGTIIVASIESYIQTEDIERPADFGIIVIHNATTQKTEACVSRGVTVPPAYVSLAQQHGCDGNPDHGSVTVGEILASKVSGLDKANWHATLSDFSRYQLLQEVMMQLDIPW